MLSRLSRCGAESSSSTSSPCWAAASCSALPVPPESPVCGENSRTSEQSAATHSGSNNRFEQSVRTIGSNNRLPPIPPPIPVRTIGFEQSAEQSAATHSGHPFRPATHSGHPFRPPDLCDKLRRDAIQELRSGSRGPRGDNRRRGARSRTRDRTRERPFREA